MQDIEPYRLVINPLQGGNDKAWENGGNQVKQRFEKLLKEINDKNI